MRIKDFSGAQQFLFQQIPRGKKLMFPGSLGLKRTQYLLKCLGSPQNQLRIIHVAGTSGKGSTSYLISLMLKSLGFRVGLHLSPHLHDVRERLQIDNRLISQEKFVYYLNRLLPAIETVKNTTLGSPTYFEILVALAFYGFVGEHVDYAVVETGMGGLYDATNTVERKDKLVVLTKIGLDHTRILGNTIGKIALQKAEIIQSSNTVVSLWQRKSARLVIEEVAQKRGAEVRFVKKDKNFKHMQTNTEGTVFDFAFHDKKISGVRLGLTGSHQAENCALALAAIYLLSKRDGFTFNVSTIKAILPHARFAGRLEVVKKGGKTIIIDVAHNPQKMATFIKNLKMLFPHNTFDFLIAFKKDKDYMQMLKYIVPVAQNITVTSFFVDRQDLIHLSQDPEEVGEAISDLQYNNYEVVRDPRSALTHALSSARTLLVITGSVYFVGEIYPLLEVYFGHSTTST